MVPVDEMPEVGGDQDVVLKQLPLVINQILFCIVLLFLWSFLLILSYFFSIQCISVTMRKSKKNPTFH